MAQLLQQMATQQQLQLRQQWQQLVQEMAAQHHVTQECLVHQMVMLLRPINPPALNQEGQGSKRTGGAPSMAHSYGAQCQPRGLPDDI